MEMVTKKYTRFDGLQAKKISEAIRTLDKVKSHLDSIVTDNKATRETILKRSVDIEVVNEFLEMLTTDGIEI